MNALPHALVDFIGKPRKLIGWPPRISISEMLGLCAISLVFVIVGSLGWSNFKTRLQVQKNTRNIEIHHSLGTYHVIVPDNFESNLLQTETLTICNEDDWKCRTFKANE